MQEPRVEATLMPPQMPRLARMYIYIYIYIYISQATAACTCMHDIRPSARTCTMQIMVIIVRTLTVYIIIILKQYIVFKKKYTTLINIYSQF